LAKGGILLGGTALKSNKILINFAILVLDYNVFLFVAKRIVMEKEP
jgi:hypothetical protein